MKNETMIADEILKHANFVRRLALHLTQDKSRADDIEQDVWLAASKRPPTEKKSVKGWLRVVVRNLVARQKNEESRGPKAVAPETLDGIAGISSRSTKDRRLLQSVVDHVMDLPEPHQTLVVLKYYEGLSVREIAERTGMTQPQARHQVEKALELLESSLSKELDETTPDWKASLALVCGLGGFTKTKSTIGLGLMMAKAKTVGVSAMVVLVCAFSYLGWQALDDEELVDLEARHTFEQGERTTGARRGSKKERQPKSVTPTAQPATAGEEATELADGSVRVSFTWEVDGSAAKDLDVRVSNDNGISWRALRADSLGQLILREVSGSCRIRTPRIPAQDLTEIKGSSEKEVRVTIPLGVDVVGKVVDETGSAIAGANIVVAGSNTFASAEKVGVSSADGTFRLQQIAGRSYVAATHRDFAPSHLYSPTTSLRGKAKIPIILKLSSQWASISGRVTDERGAPVSGALVKAGIDAWVREADESGTARYSQPASLIRTDSDGTFETGRIPAGRIDLLIATNNIGQAIYRKRISLEAQQSRHLEVQLGRSSTVFGVAKDETGKPLAGVYVYSDFRDRDLTAPRLLVEATDRDGRYSLVGLPEGSHQMTARTRSGAIVRSTLRLLLSLGQ